MSHVTRFLKSKSNNPSENIFCKPSTSEEVVDILFHHFCDGIVCPSPLHPDQIKSELVAYILTNWESRKFRKYSFLKRMWLKFMCFIRNIPIYRYY